MESQHRLVAGLALALALVASTYIAAHSWVKVKSYVVRTIEVTGSLPVTFADWGIPNPSFGPASVGETGTMEFAVVFTPA